MSIYKKILFLVVATALTLAIVLILIGSWFLSSTTDSASERQSKASYLAVQQMVETLDSMQASLADTLEYGKVLSRAVAQNDIEVIRTFSKAVARNSLIDMVTVCDVDGIVLARGHSDQAGDLLGEGFPGVLIPLATKKRVSGIEIINSSMLLRTTGVPIFYKEKLVGVAIFATILSNDSFANKIKKSQEVDFSIFYGKTRISTTLHDGEKSLVGTTLDNQTIVDTVLGYEETITARHSVAGKDFDIICWPWQDMSGKTAGMFLVSTQRDEIVTTLCHSIVMYSAAVLVITLFMIILGFIVSRAIAAPIKKITEHAQAVAAGDLEHSFSVTSEDEVGLLAKSLSLMIGNLKENNQNLHKQVEEQLQEVKHQEQLLQTLTEVASILLASDVAEFDRTLWECMGMLAKSANIDRVRIWKNFERDGKLYCTQVDEWSEGAPPLEGAAIATERSYDDIIPGWKEIFLAGRSISGMVREFSEEEQKRLRPQGVRSLLVVPAFLQNKFWGFVGYDDCHEERVFTEKEKSVLRSGGLLIANALLRNVMTKDLIQASEDALSSAKAKSNFLANMSHEIRTPINAITGMATIARNSDELKKIYSCLDKVDAASRQLLGIINDILDMSKIEANRMELALEPFRLSATIVNIQSIIGVQTAGKRQTLHVHMADDLPKVVIGDEMRLSQILLNLLSNAVKFTPTEGSISLSLKLLHTRDGVHWLQVQVQDTGIGMSNEQLSRVFNSFEQADKGTSKRFGGTGLGLAISKSIAELMNGSISVESEPGKGSCFTLSFCLQVGDETLLIQSQTCEVLEGDFAGYTALLVEDIAINREIAQALLEGSGIKVECVENGQEAVDAFGADPQRYDIIFMDVHMPVMDGYTATKIIRSIDAPTAGKVPILAMTANAFTEDITACRAAGMNDHVAKPIEINLLLNKMAQFLRKR